MDCPTAWSRLARLGEGLESPGSLAARQSHWLAACLARNASTAYGRRHGFADLADPQAYRRRVPLADYEDLAPLIERSLAGEPDLLFAGLPVACERTGGSTGGGKLIPYSQASLLDFQRGLLPWLARLVRRHGLDQAGAGPAYWAISPVARAPERTPGGIPVGLPDGAYLGEAALPAFAALSAVDPRVAGLVDLDAWRLATLHGLVRAGDLSLVSVWSPSFFQLLLDALGTHAATLALLLVRGGEVGGLHLPADPAAADRLAACLADGDTRHLWPRLRLLSCWGDAGSRAGFAALQARLPQAVCEAKGLLSTEGVATLPHPEGGGVLAADSGFFELLDDGGDTRFAWELAEGDAGELLLTTASGLYRYRSGDRVRCLGSSPAGPRLEFLGRGRLVSDLVGEKLDDAFVAGCLLSCQDQAGGAGGLALLVPDPAVPGYLLLRDQPPAPGQLERLEAALARNPQYAYARRLGQLTPLRARVVPDALQRYTAWQLARGRRLGDIKLPALLTDPDGLAALVGNTSAGDTP